MTFRQGPANLSTIREENHPDWDGKTRKNPFQEMWSANESFIFKTQMNSSIFDKVIQRESEYQTSLVFKWLKRGWMPNDPLFECHLNTGQPNHLNTGKL